MRLACGFDPIIYNFAWQKQKQCFTHNVIQESYSRYSNAKYLCKRSSTSLVSQFLRTNFMKTSFANGRPNV